MANTRDSKSALLQQQTALARFGELAMHSEDMDAILQEACRRVCEGLHTDLAKVLELQPDGRTLLVRAGVGWDPGVVGNATSIATENSFDGEALRTQEPVLCADVADESRQVADFVREHGVSAFVNVNILSPGASGSYGILEVDCREPRQFTQDDIDFLRTYANLIAVVVQRLKVNAELRRRADENEQLLKELQHRIKNNLQILTSLVHLQSRRVTNPAARDELSKVAQRINALNLVHEKLYATGQVDRIELGGYLGDIARSLIRLYEERAGAVRLVTDAARIEVPPELAITLGLIANEFVTNSLKYAFGDGGGTLGIELKRQPDSGIRLLLWDDGKGMPAAGRRGSGMDLIDALSRPIAREVEWQKAPGMRLRLVVTPPVTDGR